MSRGHHEHCGLHGVGVSTPIGMPAHAKPLHVTSKPHVTAVNLKRKNTTLSLGRGTFSESGVSEEPFRVKFQRWCSAGWDSGLPYSVVSPELDWYSRAGVKSSLGEHKPCWSSPSPLVPRGRHLRHVTRFGMLQGCSLVRLWAYFLSLPRRHAHWEGCTRHSQYNRASAQLRTTVSCFVHWRIVPLFVVLEAVTIHLFLW